MTDIYTINLIDILPQSIKEDPQVKAMATAISHELQEISNEIHRCILIPRVIKLQDPDYPLEFPDGVVDLLAWQFHVDFYNPDYPIEIKRDLVSNALHLHRRKGTPVAIEELIATVFGDGKVVEWFEYGGAPYMFKVVTFNQSVTGEQAAEFTQALNSVKNTRSWLESIEITITDDLPIYFAGIVYSGDNLTLEQVV